MTEPERYTRPAALREDHRTDGFASGEPCLDDWLRERALDNRQRGASGTYVSCRSGMRTVAGFYAVSMGSIGAGDVSGAMRRNMPRIIPAVMLGRLAVDLREQGHGLGAGLLQDAVLRSMRAAEEVSARLMLVHAISPAAEAFYVRHGFLRLPVDTPTFALDLVNFARRLKS